MEDTGTSGARVCPVTGAAMLASSCAADSSYVRISDSCLLKLSTDAPRPQNTEAAPLTLRFAVLRRAKVYI